MWRKTKVNATKRNEKYRVQTEFFSLRSSNLFSRYILHVHVLQSGISIKSSTQSNTNGCCIDFSENFAIDRNVICRDKQLPSLEFLRHRDIRDVSQIILRNLITIGNS